MREIDSKQITDVVARLCVEANRHLAPDVRECIEGCRACEPWPIAQNILDRIIENYNIADETEMAICQDTGLACVFLEIGQPLFGAVQTEIVNPKVMGVWLGTTSSPMPSSPH